MAGVRPRFGEGRALSVGYTPAEALSGGAVVERRAGDRVVGLAASGSLRACGVALKDVVDTRVVAHDVVVDEQHGLPVVRGCVVSVVFDDAATAGDKLIVAATAGQVTPAGVTPDARTVIGEAFETVAAGEEGLAYIY